MSRGLDSRCLSHGEQLGANTYYAYPRFPIKTQVISMMIPKYGSACPLDPFRSSVKFSPWPVCNVVHMPDVWKLHLQKLATSSPCITCSQSTSKLHKCFQEIRFPGNIVIARLFRAHIREAQDIIVSADWFHERTRDVKAKTCPRAHLAFDDSLVLCSEYKCTRLDLRAHWVKSRWYMIGKMCKSC